MGQEVNHSHFSAVESEEFAKRLKAETTLLNKKIHHGDFSSHAPVGGFEIEAWLLDKAMRPAPLNEQFFAVFDNPLATPELAKFNIELNNEPLELKGNALERFEQDLLAVFQDADKAAKQINTDIALIGTLPTLQTGDCCVANMSAMKRYKALNEIVLNARGNRPLTLDIQGKDHLKISPDSVMMEAATTSFQIHLQTPWKLAHHYYNASIIASAPLMAISGNSPHLFGKQLWQETRIPLFEQSVDTGSGLQRVSFGTGYAEQSISECFDQNVRDFPVLLPMLFDDKPEAFSHLRLHNGVIWRWNRPLIGFDTDGTPHVRIEHRILPAGPSIVDMVANAAFFYGLTQNLCEELSENKGQKMPFEQARNNFYNAAKQGLLAEINWNNQHYSGAGLQKLMIEDLLPRAKKGLQQLEISQDSIAYYLDIIAARCASGQTGAIWQIDHLKKTQGNTQQLLEDYLQYQHRNIPVHLWNH